VANVADTVDAPPNDARLPATSTLDMLVRRPIALGHLRGGIYVDVRNLLNRRNILAVRRDTGEPGANETIINTMAGAALAAHPEPIPFESPRYRPAADLDHNGYVEAGELLPMYLAAARDFTTPIFAYGTPRLVRLGMEFVF
jgi:hypothetical protein